MSELRRTVRQKSLLRGLVYIESGPCATECTVRDISELGARLRFATSLVGVFETLELEIPLKAQKYKCRVVWRADNDIGVSFTGYSAVQSAGESSIAERISRLERWSHFLRQPAKVGSSMLRMTHHEDAETVFG